MSEQQDTPLDPALIEEWRKLHTAHGIYDECGHKHVEDDPEAIRVWDVGLTCEAGLTQTVCRFCDTDDGEATEDTEYGEWPCTVARLIREWYDKRELLAHAGLALSRAAELLDCTGECDEDSPCPPCLVYADAVAAIAAIREGR